MRSTAQMRALEGRAMASGQISGAQLMAHAGQAVVTAILARFPLRLGHRVQVLCGPGNNGGDGFVIARLLQGRGFEVQVLAVPSLRRSADAQAARQAWRADGGRTAVLSAAALADGQAADLYIDALFGIGLTRPLTGDLARVAQGLQAQAQRVVAVDVPSGLCADRGVALGGVAVRAALTVSFDCPKPGHILADGPDRCGALAVADIGLAPWRDDPGMTLFPGLPGAAPADAAHSPTIQDLDKRSGHKFTHGHVLVLAGGPGQGGAARLAARAALRIGAGLVTVGAPRAALAENAARLEAVMLRPVEGGADLIRLLQDGRITTLCLGPALGLGARATDLLRAALAARRPTVLDADALTLIARDDSLRAALHPDCILTPHEGEFTRLFPRDTAAASPSKIDRVRRAAEALGVTLLLKGPDTVIATATGQVWVHGAVYDQAVPWLATAGSGDVLAGLIAGARARGLPHAVPLATCLHAAAARHVGPGLIAEDLPQAIPAVLRQVLLPPSG